MIVHPIQQSVKAGKVRVSAAIEVETHGAASLFPEQLWYEFPEDVCDGLRVTSDGMAAAVLLLASSLGERLKLTEAISPRLLYGMEEYLRVFNCWFPARFPIIPIEPSSRAVGLLPSSKGVATAFSGGVDSSYTLWTHLPEREKHEGYRLSHAVFIHGLDIPLSDEITFNVASRAYEAMLQQVGVRLLTVRTNARQFTTGLPWELAHGAILLSVPLLLGRLLQRFFVPASTTYVDVGEWGSDPLVDHLLSTETLDIVHDGASAYRVDKVRAISTWPLVYSHLRTCWEKPNKLLNCCHCYTCHITMGALEAETALKRFETFPLPLDAERVRRTPIPSGWRVEVDALVNRLWEVGQRELAESFAWAIVKEDANQNGHARKWWQRASKWIFRRG